MENEFLLQFHFMDSKKSINTSAKSQKQMKTGTLFLMLVVLTSLIAITTTTQLSVPNTLAQEENITMEEATNAFIAQDNETMEEATNALLANMTTGNMTTGNMTTGNMTTGNMTF